MEGEKYAVVVDVTTSRNPILLVRALVNALDKTGVTPEVRKEILDQALRPGSTEGLVAVIETYFCTSPEELEELENSPVKTGERSYMLPEE